MSTIIIVGLAALIACPCEAISAHLNRPRPRVYRKPDSPNRRKKSPHTYHSREL